MPPECQEAGRGCRKNLDTSKATPPERHTVGTKKTLLFLAAAGVCAMGWTAETSPGAPHRMGLFNTTMREGVACYRIPAMVTAPNGDIIAAIDERVDSCADLNKNRDINIVVRRSADNGDTWSDIETVADHEKGVSASDPSMIVERASGGVLLFYNHMDLDKEPGVYRLHVTKSLDNGKTWGEPEDITSQITKPEWRDDFQFITSGRGIQTRSGLLLHTLVNLDKGLHLFGSEDGGRNWHLVDAPLVPGDESKVVELADGSWMVNSRVKGAGFRYVHTSGDDGKTWTTRPEPALADPACNASLIRLSSVAGGDDRNRLLFSNAASGRRRNNMTVRLSYDEGETWTEEKTIYAGPSAYSTLTVLKNGDIGLLFEKDDHKENEFVRFSLEWLTDGRDRFNPQAAAVNRTDHWTAPFAGRIHTAWRDGRPMPQISAAWPDATLAEAYLAQKHFVARMLKPGEVGGYKAAGVASAAPGHPLVAVMPASGILHAKDNVIIDLADDPHRHVENEIGYLFHKPITKPPADVDALRQCVQAVVAIVEVPGGAVEELQPATTNDIVAWNINAKAMILGDAHEPGAIDPDDINITLSRDGETVNTARGGMAAGGQWGTLLKTVNHVLQQGYTVQPGHIITNGALGQILKAEPGRYHADYGPLGVIEFEVRQSNTGPGDVKP